MEVIPAFKVRYITETTSKSAGWDLIDIKEAKTYRIEIEDFELIPEHDEKLKEFEELLKFRDERLKDKKHIKILAYGKDKENRTIAIALLKDLTAENGKYIIIAYDVEKELKTLRTYKYYVLNL
jgi:hypothetical protein